MKGVEDGGDESHAVSVGFGATAGAVSGAAVGAAGGPAGAAVGAIIGGAAGGLLGRGVGEAINPKNEHDYWARNFRGRPYVRDGDPYELYLPAFRFGWETWPRYAAEGLSFDEAEPDLETEWDAGPGGSGFGWPRARCAARDAWERLEERADRESRPVLLRLARMNLAAATTLTDACTHAPQKDRSYFDALANQRTAAAEELATLAERSVDELHGSASESFLHEIHEEWIEIKTLVKPDPDAFRRECIRSLEHLRRVYESALRGPLSRSARVVVTRSARTLDGTILELRG